MECTFISIHDLSLDARLLYVSTSIEDILGYKPCEVVGKSCWEYFHPDEIPFAQSIHGRSIQLDKAAVLNYCQIKNRDGRWVGCECVFTIVHDVLVASTSIYRRGPSSQKRAIEAPVIRQLFSSSPRDPRYHMLSYISHKFSQEIPTHVNEPRAALFLNRFSRTLTIMYATNGLADVLGVTSDQLLNKSFYFCIQENCLREAVKCLESAKANDSIAYLRFWFRDPTQDSRQNSNRHDEDETMTDGNSSGDEDDGGVHLAELMDHDGNENAIASDSSNSMRSSAEPHYGQLLDPNSRSSSGNSTDRDGSIQDPIFDQPAGGQSRTSSVSTPDDAHSSNQSLSPEQPPIEIEAVVSCTSDGLVVVLRRAKPFVAQITTTVAGPMKKNYANGFFASPWANHSTPNSQYHRTPLHDTTNAPHFSTHPVASQADIATSSGPDSQDFMNSIREVVVFAWSLTGINGSMGEFGRGIPSGESVPAHGYPVWDPNSNAGPERHFKDEYIANGYNHKLDRRPATDGQTEPSPGSVNGYHQSQAQDHPYTSLGPPDGLSPPSDHFKYGSTVQDHMAKPNGHGNVALTNRYGVDSQDSGNAYHAFHGNAKSEKFNPDSQSTVKIEYDPFASNQYPQSNTTYNGAQNGSLQNTMSTTEYDPYAPTSYQGPAASAHTSGSHAVPHVGNQWGVTTQGPQSAWNAHRY